MPKVVYNATQGLVQQAGSGIQFSELPFSPVQAQTAAATITVPGVYSISASTAGALEMTLPLAASFPGGLFVFRAASADAHFVTASAETMGTDALTNGVSKGSKLALAAVIGSSVTLLSDGVNYCVLGNSGSLAISGT